MNGQRLDRSRLARCVRLFGSGPAPSLGRKLNRHIVAPGSSSDASPHVYRECRWLWGKRSAL